MDKVRSDDGTAIAYDRAGDGPPLIFVDGAFCSRAMGPGKDLTAPLAEHYTVYTYDRRGRGESGDTAPYSVEREVEDLQALIERAGGSAFVFGHSSGAALALEAAARGSSISQLALYEAPYIVDDSRPPIPDDIASEMNELLAEERRGDVVRLFMRQVGAPRVMIALMRFMPMWSKLKAVAHTVPYDMTIVSGKTAGEALPASEWTGVTMPTLVAVGGKSPEWFHNSMEALTESLPNAVLQVAEGQTHRIKPKALAPLLTGFFGAANRTPSLSIAGSMVAG